MPEKSNGFGRVWTRELGLTEKKQQKLLPLTRFHFLRIKNSAYNITTLFSSLCVPLISFFETVERYSRNLVWIL
jgi:hypothetical protein